MKRRVNWKVIVRCAGVLVLVVALGVGWCTFKMPPDPLPEKISIKIVNPDPARMSFLVPQSMQVKGSVVRLSKDEFLARAKGTVFVDQQGTTGITLWGGDGGPLILKAVVREMGTNISTRTSSATFKVSSELVQMDFTQWRPSRKEGFGILALFLLIVGGACFFGTFERKQRKSTASAVS